MVLRIRQAVMEDLDRLSAIESVCFPPEQGAGREAIRRRLEAYPDHVLVGELGGEVVGHIMGPVIDKLYIQDEMYADTGCHSPKHPYQSVFSLSVIPTVRRRGIGGQLIHALIALARQEERLAVTLTCLAEKVPYYESFGFEKRGVSDSVHGGVTWYNMVLDL